MTRTLETQLHPLHWAERTPDKPAWHFKGTTTSYAELAVQILQGANFLRRLGLNTGDGIAVLSENHVNSLALFWAAQICGLYYTAISAQFQNTEVNYILGDCDAKLLITSPSQHDKTREAPQQRRLNIDEWQQLIGAESQQMIKDAAEGAEMLYSSGTTGRPKGVRATTPGADLGQVSELFKRRLELHQINQNAVYLSTAPLYHSAPLRYNNMMHRCGATSVIMAHFDPAESLHLIEKYAVTHSQWVPTMFVRLLRLPESVRASHDLSSQRYAIHAAAPCPVMIKQAMIDWWGPILYEYYSGTEGNGQTAISPQEWTTHKGSVGQAILGELHITDADGNDQPAGSEGAVYFSGGPEFEYHKDPEKTRSAFNARGWSTLGDIGYLDNDGYLYLTDRASHMIITGGVNVYPREVEEVLLMHPAIQDAAVFGVPDDEFGEAVKAAVEPVPDAQIAEMELISFCRDRIAHLKCPKSIDFHISLPRHQTGKLYKDQLKAPYWP